jgi:hypothetical protein
MSRVHLVRRNCKKKETEEHCMTATEIEQTVEFIKIKDATNSINERLLSTGAKLRFFENGKPTKEPRIYQYA